MGVYGERHSDLKQKCAAMFCIIIIISSIQKCEVKLILQLNYFSVQMNISYS